MKKVFSAKILQTVWNALAISYSYRLGVAVNGLLLLAQGLLKMFPGDSRSWFPPTWFIVIYLFVGILMFAGFLLAIRDFLKQQRLLALIGFLLCCWPILLALWDGVVRWITIQLRPL